MLTVVRVCVNDLLILRCRIFPCGACYNPERVGLRVSQIEEVPIKRLALITGASAGLGMAFSKAYARRGFDVALVARRADRLEALAGELRDMCGVVALVIAQDLAAPDAEGQVLSQLATLERHADVLVNNAGFSIAQDFEGVPWGRQRDMLMTMVVSACGLTHGVLPKMLHQGYGRIINVASVAAFAPGVGGHSLYPGVKSLTVKFSQALDAELRGSGVQVTALCPGSTHTEFTQANGTEQAGRGAPPFLVQTTQAVVEAAILGNEAGRVVVIPGWHNRLAVSLLRTLPERLVRPLLMRGSAKYRLPPEPGSPELYE